MNYLAYNSANLNGEIICPGDKSISQRIVMIASLINADIKISGFLNGNDPISTANALNQIGAKIEITDTNVNVSTSAEASAEVDTFTFVSVISILAPI